MAEDRRDSGLKRRSSRFMGRWWPIPVALGGSLGLQKVFFESRYDVSGHAAEHLSSATAPFLAVALVVILLWATPPARRQPDLLLACGAWLIAAGLVLVGNVRVVDALIRAGMGRTATDQLVMTPDIEAAHGWANLAPWLGVTTALILITVLWRRRYVSTPVAIGAGAASLLVPPWILPGAGVIVSVFARVLPRRRRSLADPRR